MDKIFKLFGKSKKNEKNEKQEKIEKHVEISEEKFLKNSIFNPNDSHKVSHNEIVVKTLINNSDNSENIQNKQNNFFYNNPTENILISELNTQIPRHNLLSQSNQTQSSFLSSNDNVKANDVVVVNTPEPNPKSKLEGFYYKKYINKIQKLSISNPILVEREKMKITFDSEVMDYLMNDLTMIFREKQKVIDQNQENILKEIQESKDLIGVMLGIHNDATFNYSLDFYHKQQKFMRDVDYLEVVVNTLNMEVDGLLAQMEFIENKLNLNEEEVKVQENQEEGKSI